MDTARLARGPTWQLTEMTLPDSSVSFRDVGKLRSAADGVGKPSACAHAHSLDEVRGNRARARGFAREAARENFGRAGATVGGTTWSAWPGCASNQSHSLDSSTSHMSITPTRARSASFTSR